MGTPGPEPGSREVLFRSPDLLVARAAGFSRDCCVVTFDSFTDERTLDREGFGESFLRSRKVDAVHVISRGNDWYQYAETEAAMACVRAATQPYARVVTYGSSMGAYAAIRLAGLAGAHCALAMSPQFSVLPRTAPFEYRWDLAPRRLRPVWEGTLPLPSLPEAYLLYDPLNMDAQHAALYAASDFRFTSVRLRGAGHQVTGFLLEAGLLQKIVLATCRGPLDVPAIEKEAWRRRRGTPQHRLALAVRVRHPAWRLALVRRATVLAPGNAALIGRLATELGRAGRFAEALEAHREALALAPGHPPLLAEYSATLEASGDYAGALAVLGEMAERTGEPAHAVRLQRLRAGIAADDPASAHSEPLPAPRLRPWPWRRRQRVAGCDPGTVADSRAEPVTTEPGQRGYALFGPYIELRRGRYAVEFTVTVRPSQGDGPVDGPASGLLRRLLGRRTACILDASIHGGRTVLARRKLTVAALRASSDSRFCLHFDLPEWTACEFRLFATGTAALTIHPSRSCRRIKDREGWA